MDKSKREEGYKVAESRSIDDVAQKLAEASTKKYWRDLNAYRIVCGIPGPQVSGVAISIRTLRQLENGAYSLYPYHDW